MWAHVTKSMMATARADAGQEVAGGFVVACCDGAPVLQPAEGALGLVARAIGSRVKNWPNQAP